MIPTEKLAAACFQENLDRLGDIQRDPEKGNLYIGLRALGDSIEEISRAVRNIDRRLSQIEQQLARLQQK
jgi:hypothetical protein